MRRVFVALLISLLSTGCATSFMGKAKIPNGPAGCKTVCDNWGMDLAGMVQMGEYSNGCICQVRGKPLSQLDMSATGPAVVGVVMQMRRQQAQHQAR